MADNLENPLFGKATDAFIDLERALERFFNATGNGLGVKARSVEGKLSVHTFRSLMRVNAIRNKIVHEEGSRTTRDLAKTVEMCRVLLGRLSAEAPSQGGDQPAPSVASPAASPGVRPERVELGRHSRSAASGISVAPARRSYQTERQPVQAPVPTSRRDGNDHGVEIAFRYLAWFIGITFAIFFCTKALQVLDMLEIGPRVTQPDTNSIPQVDADWLPSPQLDNAGAQRGVLGMDATVTAPADQGPAVMPALLPQEVTIVPQPAPAPTDVPRQMDVDMPQPIQAAPPVAFADRSNEVYRSPQDAAALSPEDRFRRSVKTAAPAAQEPQRSPEDRFRRNR